MPRVDSGAFPTQPRTERSCRERRRTGRSWPTATATPSRRGKVCQQQATRATAGAVLAVDQPRGNRTQDAEDELRSDDAARGNTPVEPTHPCRAVVPAAAYGVTAVVEESSSIRYDSDASANATRHDGYGASGRPTRGAISVV